MTIDPNINLAFMRIERGDIDRAYNEMFVRSGSSKHERGGCCS